MDTNSHEEEVARYRSLLVQNAPDSVGRYDELIQKGTTKVRVAYWRALKSSPELNRLMQERIEVGGTPMNS